MKRTLIFLALGMMTAAAGWAGRGWYGVPGTPTQSSSEPNTARVMRGGIEQTVKARGIVKPAPNALVRLGFPMPKDVARRIQAMKFVEGDSVKARDTLAELDTADLQATLQQLNADVAVIERRLDASRTLEPVEVHLAKAVTEQAKAQADQAKRTYDRSNKLRATTATTLEAHEMALSDREITRAKSEQADASMTQVKARFETDIGTLEAQVRQAKAAIPNVEVQIAWSTIRSPIDGVVFAVHQRVGELTSNQPNAPVLTLLDPKQLQVHLYVDEADFGKVRSGQEVSLRVDAHAGETLKAKIVRILPQPILQENVVYYLAVAEVEEAKRPLLRMEMTALAHVRVVGDGPVLWLPSAAVRSRADGWFVRRPAAAGPFDAPVQIGKRSEGRVEIRSGLEEGDEVLLDP